MLLYRAAGSVSTRFVAVNSDGDVWAGGNDQSILYHLHWLLDADTFETLETFESGPAGAHGGFVTTAGVYWSTDHYDPFGDVLVRRVLSTGSQTDIAITAGQLMHACVLDPLTGDVWACSNDGAQPALKRFSAAGVELASYQLSNGGANPTRYTARTIAYDHVRDQIVTTHDHALVNSIRRWNKSTGALVEEILLNTGLNPGTTPRGLGFDLNGKLWVCCTGNSTVKRITIGSPSTVDTTISLGTRAPYGYADIGGTFPFIVTQPSGMWHVVYDHGSTANWGRVSWTELTPATCSFSVQYRLAATRAQLADQEWIDGKNGASFGPLAAQFVEVRCMFLRPDQSTDTPVLYDLTLETLDPAVVPTTAPRAGEIVQPVARGEIKSVAVAAGLAR